MIATLKALFMVAFGALRDWLRDRAKDAALKSEAHATNDREDLERDVENAERITRAVDAVRNSGGVRDLDPASPTAKPDTRGYRD